MAVLRVLREDHGETPGRSFQDALVIVESSGDELARAGDLRGVRGTGLVQLAERALG
jgi:hypothetical protein